MDGALDELNIPDLPDDILHLICEQLGAQLEFTTLLSCALAGSRFSEPALKTLYRLHDRSPLVSGQDVLELLGNRKHSNADAERNLITRRWAILWKSILRSALGHTYRPYSQFIRSLNLEDLESLLEDSKFRGEIERSFFSDDLSQFNIRKDSPFLRNKGKPISVLDNESVMNAVGETITGNAHLLEELSGHKVQSGRLPGWISNLPRLETLRIWSGEALKNGTGRAIRERCLNFRALTIYAWDRSNADEQFKTFLQELAANSIQYLAILGLSQVSSESFNALSSCHGASLRVLRLSGLCEAAVKSLDKLSSCTSLHSLTLECHINVTVRLEETQADVYLAVVKWLSSCQSLASLDLKALYDGPSILAAVLDSSTGKAPPPLIHLRVEGYQLYQLAAANFHSSLPVLSETLTSLSLKADGEDAMPTHLDLLVNSISRLPLLRSLYLQELSNNFNDDLVINLALALPNLVDFYTSGYEITDAVLPVLATLSNLKNLHMEATTRFTYQGIMNFIHQLRPESEDGVGDGNRGFSFIVMNAEARSNLTESQQRRIRKSIDAKVGGRFDFTLWRDEEDSQFDGDSD